VRPAWRRTCEPFKENRIDGVAEQGERPETAKLS
jgi:hypothetical protein